MESASRNLAAKVAKDLENTIKEKRRYNETPYKSSVYKDLERVKTNIREAVHFQLSLDTVANNYSKLKSNPPLSYHLPYRSITVHFDNLDYLIVATEFTLNRFDNAVKYSEGQLNAALLNSRDNFIEKYPSGSIIFDVVFMRDGWQASVLPFCIKINCAVKKQYADGKENSFVHKDIVRKLGLEIGNVESMAKIKLFIDQLVAYFLNFLHSLATTHTEEVIQQASPKNNRRILDGKLPIWEVKTLVLKTPVTRTVSEYQGGTHASPRQHIRRGHYRHYKSGKIAWVRDCIVGSLEKGFVHKDYRVEPAAA